jgi:hypothetical protein
MTKGLHKKKKKKKKKKNGRVEQRTLAEAHEDLVVELLDAFDVLVIVR